MDSTFALVLTGCDFDGRDPIKDAVARRFTEIQDKLNRKPGLEHPDWTERHIYDGNRCKPENMGWRFVQNYQLGKGPDIELTETNILSGKFDDLIELNWHDAANSEYWYAFEKSWD